MFIKLSSVVINSRFIQKIIIKPNKYVIHVKNLEKSATIIAGSGGYNQWAEEWPIFKDTVDYDVVTKYIERLSMNKSF
jgi:hypothetical protein